MVPATIDLREDANPVFKKKNRDSCGVDGNIVCYVPLEKGDRGKRRYHQEKRDWKGDDP